MEYGSVKPLAQAALATHELELLPVCCPVNVSTDLLYEVDELLNLLRAVHTVPDGNLYKARLAPRDPLRLCETCFQSRGVHQAMISCAAPPTPLRTAPSCARRSSATPSAGSRSSPIRKSTGPSSRPSTLRGCASMQTARLTGSSPLSPPAGATAAAPVAPAPRAQHPPRRRVRRGCFRS